MHHDQPVAVGNGMTHVVGDHQCGQLIFRNQTLGGVQYFFRRFGIQRGRMLVQQEEPRLLQCGHQQRQGLPLSAGKQPDFRRQPVFQTQIQDFQFLPELFAFLCRYAPAKAAAFPAAPGERQVFINLHRGGRSCHRILEYAADQLRSFKIRKAGHVFTVDPDRTGIDRPDTGDRIQHR